LLIAEVRIDIKVAHSERVMPTVEWLLASAHTEIKDIDAFAVSIGPGSFTGLRIGLSTVKGFAYSTGKPVIPVRTLDAFARTIPFSRYLICPMLDARKNEVYAALYRWDNGECLKVLSETVIKPAELLEEIHEPVVVTGDGAETYKEIIGDSLKDKALFAPPSRMSPSASTVAEIGIEQMREGIVSDPLTLSPFYIRKSEAEVRWKG
jgi:tRNA threonylcarbamoyladenosine biosynthesis protein TsaB